MCMNCLHWLRLQVVEVPSDVTQGEECGCGLAGDIEMLCNLYCFLQNIAYFEKNIAITFIKV